jgi:tetratricopeptide (TPR) repeat protein
VTSRERLRVRGEVEYAVPPLAEPEAVRLFCDRSGLGPSDEIAELCIRLDSMPLAVELAAARTKALSPAQMLERLSSRLDLLRGGRDADPRQQTLRATIEWSYDLLSDREQRLFARLAVFAESWTLEAAEEICGADLDSLQALVEKSLVRFMDERYFMFATIRDFAEERLEESRRSEALRRRHAEYFTHTAEAMHREWMYGTDQRSANFWFTRERANLRPAVERTEERLNLHLRLLHSIRSHATLSVTELRNWLEKAVPRAVELQPILHARVLAGFAEALNATADFESALVYHERARSLYRSLGDEEGTAACLVGLAYDLAGLGRLTEARDMCEQALHLAREASSFPVIIGASTGLAFLALEERDFEKALSLAADLEELEPDPWRVSPAIAGLVALESGDAAKAIRLLQGCVAESYEIGAGSALASDLDALAAALAARGDLEKAVVLCGYSGGASRLTRIAAGPALSSASQVCRRRRAGQARRRRVLRSHCTRRAYEPRGGRRAGAPRCVISLQSGKC